MEKYVYQIIPVEELCFDTVYTCHFRVNDERIEASVLEMGIQSPLLLTPAPDFKIVDGYKRALAAKKLHLSVVPAMVLQIPLSEKDYFLQAVYTNWALKWSDIDRIYVIQKALTDFKMTPVEIVTKVLPALALKPQAQTYAVYAALTKLVPALWIPISEGKVSLQAASTLCLFSKEDQQWIASELIPQLSLTAAQVILVTEWLLEISRSTPNSLQAFLEAHGLIKSLSSAPLDKRKKTECFVEAISRLRFPKLTGPKEHFKKLTQDISQAHKDIKLEAHPFFEDEGYTVCLKVRNPKSLDELLPALEKLRTLLNSFFDFMV